METDIFKGSDLVDPSYGTATHLILDGHTLYTANTHFMHVNDIDWIGLLPTLHMSFQIYPCYNEYIEKYTIYIDDYAETNSAIDEFDLRKCFEQLYRDYETFINQSIHRELLKSVDLYTAYFDPETLQLTFTVMQER